MDISTCRQEIDRIDVELVKLLNERAQQAQYIGAYKLEKKQSSLYDPSREAQLVTQLSALTQGPLSATHIERIYREIISSCLSLEQVQKVAYLGPEGTFTQMAAHNHFGSSAEFTSCASIADAFDAVERKQVDFCVVPIENSTEGVISLTLELLAVSNLRIIGEQELLVEHCLLTQKRKPLSEIHTVYAHQQALAQCQHWIKEHLPMARVEAIASNSRGAQLAAENPGSAAIGARINASLYGLNVVAEKIEDVIGNKTRFVVIGNIDVAATGKDKTAVIFSTPHKPGSLFHALKHFNDHNVDLVRLESKPLKNASWDYSFFVEFHGHVKETHIQKLLESLHEDTLSIKFLGSFPQPMEA